MIKQKKDRFSTKGPVCTLPGSLNITCWSVRRGVKVNGGDMFDCLI